jgi:hypothetical protein
MEIFEKVTAPGFKGAIFGGIVDDAYHAGPGISSSGLKEIARTPLHYWEKYINPDHERKEDSAVFALGKAIHAAILEPERFANEYIAEPLPSDLPDHLNSLTDYKDMAKELSLKGVSTLNKPELKAALLGVNPDLKFFDDAFAEITQGKKIIKPEHMDSCENIAGKVRENKAARFLLKDGQAEQSVYWVDEVTGVLCRVRPDYLSSVACLDVKSTEDASKEAFERSIWNYGYYISAAFYLDGIKAVMGIDMPFVFIAWEKFAPNAVAFYAADEDMIAIGRREYRRLLNIYAECQRKGQWPGYPEAIQPIGLPEFAQRKLER